MKNNEKGEQLWNSWKAMNEQGWIRWIDEGKFLWNSLFYLFFTIKLIMKKRWKANDEEEDDKDDNDDPWLWSFIHWNKWHNS